MYVIYQAKLAMTAQAVAAVLIQELMGPLLVIVVGVHREKFVMYPTANVPVVKVVGQQPARVMAAVAVPIGSVALEIALRAVIFVLGQSQLKSRFQAGRLLAAKLVVVISQVEGLVETVALGSNALKITQDVPVVRAVVLPVAV